jgi:hypothetical protein
MGQLEQDGQGDPLLGPSAFDESSKAPHLAKWEGPESPPHQFQDGFDSLESCLGDPADP